MAEEPLQQVAPTEPANPENKQTDDNTFSFSYVILFTDYVLRCLVLEIWHYNLFPNWLFWSIQLLMCIPVLWFAGRRRQKIISKYNLTGQIFFDNSSWGIFWYVVILMSGASITYSLLAGLAWWGRLLITIILFFLHSTYIMAIIGSSPQKINRADRMKEIDSLFKEQVDEVDANDLRIIRMESEITSITQRVDSFTLESALFGALAFSGFLTLLVAEKPLLEYIQNVVTAAMAIVSEFRELDFSRLLALFHLFSTPDYLLGLIAIQTLICSMFFASLIVSRLRFYSILKKVDYGIRIARMYNSKEEEAYCLLLESPEAKPAVQARMTLMSQNVSNSIAEVNPLFRDLTYVTGFMWGLRNLGIGSFVLILLTSSFLVSNTLALIFAALFTAALFYTVVDGLLRNRRLKSSDFFRKLDRKAFHRITKRNR